MFPTLNSFSSTKEERIVLKVLFKSCHFPNLNAVLNSLILSQFHIKKKKSKRGWGERTGNHLDGYISIFLQVF